MATARVTVVVDRPVAALWARLADYRGWRTWLTEVFDSAMEDGVADGPSSLGIIRRVGPPDAPLAREMLVGCDQSQHLLSYAVIGALPFPVRNYRAAVRLTPLSDVEQTVVDWSGEYDVDATDEPVAAATLDGLYRSFIAALVGATEAAPAR